MAAPILFQSTDSGAQSMTGLAGALINVLSSCLVVNSVFSTADDVSFTDNTTEARLDGGTQFKLFPTPASGDRTYIGMTNKFSQVTINLNTLGVGGTIVWEYWNGSAWTTLTVSDGTSGLTASGTLTWTAPSDWATKAVNSVTQYWVRVRASANPTTNPQAASITVLGWLEAYTASNKRAYKQGGGILQYLDVDDTGPGAATTQEARLRGYETMSAVGTGTQAYPTAAQFAAGIIVRKSAAATSTTRVWRVIADDKTFTLMIFSGDSAGNATNFHFGDACSVANGDSYRNIIIGRTTENSTVILSSTDCFGVLATTMTTTTSGHYMDRGYTGLGGSVPVIKTPADSIAMNSSAFSGAMVYPNNLDGGLYVCKLCIYDNTTPPTAGRRAYLRGVWAICHSQFTYVASVPDGTTFSGVVDGVSRSFMVISGVGGSSSPGWMAIETSNTWLTSS